jgi:hypothetical protein
MSGIFDNDEYGTDHIDEKPKDYAGFEALDSDLYKGKVKMAYLVIHESKAQGIAFEFDLGGKTLKIEQIVRTKEGKNYFVNGKTKLKAPLGGFTVVDDICTILTGKGLKGQATEEKIVKVFNFDKKEDVPTQVHVLVDLIDKEVGIAVIKKLENKSKKEGEGAATKYVATSETITRNDIVKAVHISDCATVGEKSEKKPATWAAGWLKNNKGKTKEKLTYKGGSEGSSSAASAPPTGDRKPLFS